MLAMHYIQEAHTHALRYYGREEVDEVKLMKQYVENPKGHINYLCIDRMNNFGAKRH